MKTKVMTLRDVRECKGARFFADMPPLYFRLSKIEVIREMRRSGVKSIMVYESDSGSIFVKRAA